MATSGERSQQDDRDPVDLETDHGWQYLVSGAWKPLPVTVHANLSLGTWTRVAVTDLQSGEKTWLYDQLGNENHGFLKEADFLKSLD